MSNCRRSVLSQDHDRSIITRVTENSDSDAMMMCTTRMPCVRVHKGYVSDAQSRLEKGPPGLIWAIDAYEKLIPMRQINFPCHFKLHYGPVWMATFRNLDNLALLVGEVVQWTYMIHTPHHFMRLIILMIVKSY